MNNLVELDIKMSSLPVSSEYCVENALDYLGDQWNEALDAAPKQVLSTFSKRTLIWMALIAGAAIIFVPVFLALYGWIHYRSSIRKRLKEIEAGLSTSLMYRDKKHNPQKSVRCFELNPEFRKLHPDSQLVSMGEYLSTLRVIGSTDKEDLPRILERELEATVGAIVLGKLGPRFGAAILPMLGITNVQSTIAKVASTLTTWFAAHLLVDKVERDLDPTTDHATFPLSASELFAFANIHQTAVGNNMETSPLEYMSRGEVGYDPSFYVKPLEDGNGAEEKDNKEQETAEEEAPIDLICNPFIVSKHWDKAIEGMELLMRSQEYVTDTSPSPDSEHTLTRVHYDPEDISLPEPTPINERILPGLYMGWGDAKCTHTKREIIRNRLLGVLFNKMSYNYYKKEQKADDLFVVQMNPKSEKCYYPEKFLQCLLDAGHTVDVQPRATVTTFGIAACVKEDDGTWSNIPMCCFMKTGYERADGRPAHFGAPHGGMDLTLKGPLVGKRQDGKDGKCDIQFYMAIDGLCGWHSNQNAKVPWLEPVGSTEIYTKEQALMAMRMSGLLATVLNAIGTEMELSFGGYGLLGVCNDSAAMLDFAIRGETNMYPLVSTGRFLLHIAERALILRKALKDLPGFEQEIDDTKRLITASCNMESDLHTSPAHLVGAARRFLATNAKVPHFQISSESGEILRNSSKMYEEFVESPDDAAYPNLIKRMFPNGK